MINTSDMFSAFALKAEPAENARSNLTCPRDMIDKGRAGEKLS